jgi:nitronate monooxygenase
MWKNELTKLLKIRYPIIQAPMAGGPTTSALVSAVSNAGGLGMIGAGYMQPNQIRKQIREVREVTDKPFGINLFVPTKYTMEKGKIQKAETLLQPIREQFEVDIPKSFPSYEKDLETFHEQVYILIEEKVPICSFTFGIPSTEIITKLKKHEIIVLGTATTVREAIMNERAGIDAVVVQGTEAGGHRGTFIGDFEQSLIGLMALVPQVADSISIPVIAAGGIMDGRGIMAAKCLGAFGVQLGTAFLVCQESGANTAHKDAIIKANEEQAVLTRAFSGKMARGIHNHFIGEMDVHEELLPEYPLQNELTKEIRKASTAAGNPEFMSLWGGQSPRLAKKQTVLELMNKIIQDCEKIRSRELL